MKRTHESSSEDSPLKKRPRLAPPVVKDVFVGFGWENGDGIESLSALQESESILEVACGENAIVALTAEGKVFVWSELAPTFKTLDAISAHQHKARQVSIASQKSDFCGACVTQANDLLIWSSRENTAESPAKCTETWVKDLAGKVRDVSVGQGVTLCSTHGGDVYVISRDGTCQSVEGLRGADVLKVQAWCAGGHQGMALTSAGRVHMISNNAATELTDGLLGSSRVISMAASSSTFGTTRAFLLEGGKVILEGKDALRSVPLEEAAVQVAATTCAIYALTHDGTMLSFTPYGTTEEEADVLGRVLDASRAVTVADKTRVTNIFCGPRNGIATTMAA